MRTLTAAIQFGSSRICAAAAVVNELGRYEVVAIESTSSARCIRHGVVSNIDDTAVRIKTLMQKLSNRVRAKGYRGLEAAYVGICGLSMHSVLHEPSEVLVGTPSVTDEILESLRDQSLKFSSAGLDILGIEANGYRIEGQQVIGEHQVIVADSSLKSRYEQAMNRAGVRVAGFIASPLRLSDLARQEEREQGCVIVNIGSALTTVSIYKDDHLKRLVVIPLGGDAVTNDIASTGVRQDEAETAKITWSNVADQGGSESTRSVAVAGTQLSQAELNNIVTCRYEEIAANIVNQIKISGVDLSNGVCILTGGASTQKGLTNLFHNRLNVQSIETRGCNSIIFFQSDRKPYLSELMTMLQSCNEDCEMKQRTIYQREPDNVATPQVIIRKPATARQTVAPQEHKENKKGNRLKNFIGDLFSGLDDSQ
ncbi:MAG: cell division FtsA domain-containing protein [Bacteroidales bacterium]|nr:cell division FtsA domain-containing protein [Bacteroidales bacterium]